MRLPAVLKEHLSLNTTTESTYNNVRSVVLNYIKTHQSTQLNNAPPPMEIGAVWRYLQSNGYGKSKGYKGRSKGNIKHMGTRGIQTTLIL